MATITVIRIFNTLLNGGYNSSTLGTALAGKTGDWADLLSSPVYVNKLIANTAALAVVRDSSVASPGLFSSKALADTLFVDTVTAHAAKNILSKNATSYRDFIEQWAEYALDNYKPAEVVSPPVALMGFAQSAVTGRLFACKDTATNTGCVHYSDDDGTTWKSFASREGLGFSNTVQGLASPRLSGQNNSQRGAAVGAYRCVTDDGTFVYVLCRDTDTSSTAFTSIYKTTDFVTFTFVCYLPKFNGTTDVRWQAIAVNGTNWVVAGSAGTGVDSTNTYVAHSSTSGASWTYPYTATSGYIADLKYLNGGFRLLTTTSMYSSTTGSTGWALTGTIGGGTQNMAILGYTNGSYVSAGSNNTGTGFVAYTSTDGATWTARTVSPGGSAPESHFITFDSIAYNSAEVIFTTRHYNSTGTINYCYRHRSTDTGATWTSTMVWSITIGAQYYHANPALIANIGTTFYQLIGRGSVPGQTDYVNSGGSYSEHLLASITGGTVTTVSRPGSANAAVAYKFGSHVYWLAIDLTTTLKYDTTLALLGCLDPSSYVTYNRNNSSADNTTDGGYFRATSDAMFYCNYYNTMNGVFYIAYSPDSLWWYYSRQTLGASAAGQANSYILGFQIFKTRVGGYGFVSYMNYGSDASGNTHKIQRTSTTWDGTSNDVTMSSITGRAGTLNAQLGHVPRNAFHEDVVLLSYSNSGDEVATQTDYTPAYPHPHSQSTVTWGNQGAFSSVSSNGLNQIASNSSGSFAVCANYSAGTTTDTSGVYVRSINGPFVTYSFAPVSSFLNSGSGNRSVGMVGEVVLMNDTGPVAYGVPGGSVKRAKFNGITGAARIGSGVYGSVYRTHSGRLIMSNGYQIIKIL
jgi:hypothetical protein